ncbi:MAG: AraC family transcriptional regulator ligand-binding domain-containing protein [Myxococcota bacterium]
MPSAAASFPAIYAHHAVELAARWEVDRAALLAPLGLEDVNLVDPAARLPSGEFVALFERARALTGEPGFGIHYGLAMRPATHGALGFATMTASTLGDALALGAKFVSTRTTAIDLRLVHEVEGTAGLVVEERVDFGPARDAIVLALLLGIVEIGVALTGKRRGVTLELALPEPLYLARFAPLLENRSFRFDRPAHRLLFHPEVVSRPVVFADPAAERLAREQCERELEQLGRGTDVVLQVRRALEAEGPATPLAKVAPKLGMSTRTLKRRLGARNASFTGIREQVRREVAQLALRNPDVSLTDIAERLGYSDARTFGRAFRRWTGTSPTAYRRSQGT